jgi:hypothetical protein
MPRPQPAHGAGHLLGFAPPLLARAAPGLGGIAGKLDAVEGKQRPTDQALAVTHQQHLGQDATNAPTPCTDKGGQRGEVRSGSPADGHEQAILPTGTLQGPSTHPPARVGQEDDLEQQGGGIGRGAPLIVAKPGIKLGALRLVINQITQRVFEGAGQNLAGVIDREELRPHINRLVARHRGVLAR